MSDLPHQPGREEIPEREGAAGFEPVTIVPELCIACDRCVDACQVDVFLPSTEKGEAPIVAFPGECWHSGDCVSVCPVPGAIYLNVMEKNRVRWKRKETGEEFKL